MRWSLLLAGLAGCAPVEPTFPVGQRPPDALELGPEVVCDAPVDGLDRFDAVAGELTEVPVGPDAVPGIDDEEWPAIGFERMVVVEDLDADGDLDLLIAGAGGLAVPHWNDGEARFSPGSPIAAPPGTEPDLFGVADLDGDELPEFIGQLRFGGLYVADNLDGAFGEPRHLVPPGGPRMADAIALGDLTGDGAVDAVLVSSHADGPELAAPTWVVEGPDFDDGFELGEGASIVSSQVAAVIDLDRDGTAELMELTNLPEEGQSSAIWTRSGGSWSNRASALGLEVPVVAMGISWADLDGDERPDLCASDIGPTRCWVERDSAYVEAGLALGIWPPDAPGEAFATLGWSVEVGDLDHDGEPEVLQASGFDRYAWELGRLNLRDLAWSREGEAYADVTDELGLDPDSEDHYGLVLADLDANGFLDVVAAGPTSAPMLLMNRCGAGRWLQVELVGPEANRTALGARVSVTVDGATQTVDLLGPRASGQSPSRAHFGLDDAAHVTLDVAWPDGATQTFADVPTNRLVTVRMGG